MPVPETAVNEHRDATTHENNIRIARKILSMKSKSVAHPMQL